MQDGNVSLFKDEALVMERSTRWHSILLIKFVSHVKTKQLKEGQFDLKNGKIKEIKIKDVNFAFQFEKPTQKKFKEILFGADSEEELKKWIAVFTEGIEWGKRRDWTASRNTQSIAKANY